MVDGSNPAEGRVEVNINNEWGTVCDDGWGIAEASVICRQLGYSTARSYTTSASFGQGTGEILLDNLGCSGRESSLTECRHSGVGIHNCVHSEDAGVVCASPGKCTIMSFSNSMRSLHLENVHFWFSFSSCIIMVQSNIIIS